MTNEQRIDDLVYAFGANAASRKAWKYALVFVDGDVVAPASIVKVAQNIDAIFAAEGVATA